MNRFKESLITGRDQGPATDYVDQARDARKHDPDREAAPAHAPALTYALTARQIAGRDDPTVRTEADAVRYWLHRANGHRITGRRDLADMAMDAITEILRGARP